MKGSARNKVLSLLLFTLLEGGCSMQKYTYRGPVTEFGKCIDQYWIGETIAESEIKARNNLCYQFKKQHNKMPTAKIELPGKIYKFERVR